MDLIKAFLQKFEYNWYLSKSGYQINTYTKVDNIWVIKPKNSTILEMRAVEFSSFLIV